MHDKRNLLWFSVPLVALLFVLIWLLWSVALPWAANSYGFALPGPGGLPYRISFAGHTYVNPATCARGGWCHAPYGPLNPLCWTAQDIQRQHAWPLVQVDTVPVFAGAPYPLLASRVYVASGLKVMLVFVPTENGCYVPYALGP